MVERKTVEGCFKVIFRSVVRVRLLGFLCIFSIFHLFIFLNFIASSVYCSLLIYLLLFFNCCFTKSVEHESTTFYGFEATVT